MKNTLSAFDDLQKKHEQCLAKYKLLKSKAWGDKNFLEEVGRFIRELDSFILKHKTSLDHEKKTLVHSWKEHWQGMVK
mgnify:CR=1 FL=1